MNPLDQARAHFIQGMSRISRFWGFPKAMGAIYAAIYLSPSPLSLDDLVRQAGVTKGAVSVNVRQLERLGMVHRHVEVGQRRDFYVAETDFWRIVRGILQERQQAEFDRALASVGESLALLEGAAGEEAEFARGRMAAMQAFFNALDGLVGAVLKLEGLVSLSALSHLVERAGKE
jgi:DNA-binding transcriptional regulator GbsR (MarR family)